MKSTKEFYQVLESLPAALAAIIKQTPDSVKMDAREIRLRAGREIMINLGESDYPIHHRLSREEISETFRALCAYSVHSHTEEIRRGYITLKGGHRAGLCGTAVYQDGQVTNLRDISSINLRIARQIEGVAEDLLQRLNFQPGGLLLVGAPASGKTTLLKDIIRSIKDKKVSVIDSRGELGACLMGIPQNDLGNADVFDGWNKADGMMAAIRTMAPDILVCDEIGESEDFQAVQSCMNAGVDLIASVHAGNAQELRRRTSVMQMIQMGAFRHIALLKGKRAPCAIDTILKAGDLHAYFGSSSIDHLSDHFGVCIR